MSDQLMTTHLVIMTKFPEPGKVKTRLAAAIGDKRACQLHAAMVQHLSDNTLPELTGVSVRCLLYTSPSPRDLSTSRMPSSA